MAAEANPRVFLDVHIGSEPAGRLIIELFAHQTPRTAENFRQLCTGEHNGLSYAKVPFHRVIDEFMVQGGDIAAGDGTGTVSIYGAEFEDENLSWREMDAAGLVCSANRGKDTNGSQFFITLMPSPHLNGKHTIFGRLVAGEDVLTKIAQVAVDDDDRPLEPVLVARCGELERKRKKPAAVPAHTATSSEHDDRGRRRKSGQDESDDERDRLQPPQARRTRRQSDNVVDEGIRGRPRLRSCSRADSQPLSDDDHELSSHVVSPSGENKRKRSASPSRHVEARTNDAYEQRQRRSLPNQYRAYGREDDRYRPSPRRDSHRYAGHRGGDKDRYPPRRDRYREEGRLESNDGRLGGGGGGGGGFSGDDPPVKFKGRGVMKYREERNW